MYHSAFTWIAEACRFCFLLLCCCHMQVAQRLAAPEAIASLVAEARAAAEVKDADAGKEFGRGKRNR